MARAPLLLMLLLLCPSAMASSLLLPRYADADLELMETPGYLATHPDYRWRIRGLASWRDGESAKAIEHFLRAAQHADKAAQALLGELYWSGRGTETDRMEGYVFMALAAERGYPRYQALRDRYWDELAEAQRAAALPRLAQMLELYGDTVAKPRLEEAMRGVKARRAGRGSRTSFFAKPFNSGVPGSGMSGGFGLNHPSRQDPRYWEPDAYWAWQDALYGDMRAPRVKVIELRPFVRSHPSSRGTLSEDDGVVASQAGPMD